MQNPAIEYTVIGVYLALLVAIGAVVKRFNKDDSDYFRNGCKGTWWLVGASAFICLLYTSPSPRDQRGSRMPSSA